MEKHNIFREMARLRDYLSGDSDKVRKDYYNELEKFLLKGDYTKYKDKQRFLKFAFLGDDKLARKLNIQISSVRSIRSRLTEDFYKAVEPNCLNVIEFGTIREVEISYKEFMDLRRFTDLKDMINPYLIDLIVENQLEEQDFSISDCKYELAFLYWFSNIKIKQIIKNVDINRLGYLLRVIEGKSGTLKDKANIVRVLLSPDLLSRIKTAEERKKYTFPPVRPEDEF